MPPMHPACRRAHRGRLVPWRKGAPLLKWAGGQAYPRLLPAAQAVSTPYQGRLSPRHSLPTARAFPPFRKLTMGGLGSPSSCRGGHRKGSLELPAALVLGKVQFLASWTGGGGPGSSQGSAHEKGKWLYLSSLEDPRGDVLLPAGTLTIRTGLMASVAGRSSEQSRKGWHAGVPPTHQQLFNAWHLPLQRVGTSRDFGEGRRPSQGCPWRGLQAQ